MHAANSPETPNHMHGLARLGMVIAVLAIGFVVSGALLTEIVFSYPGLGLLLVNAVADNDYALLQGIFLLITFAVLLANLIADFVYVFLDPRIRQEA